MVKAPEIPPALPPEVPPVTDEPDGPACEQPPTDVGKADDVDVPPNKVAEGACGTENKGAEHVGGTDG